VSQIYFLKLSLKKEEKLISVAKNLDGTVTFLLQTRRGNYRNVDIKNMVVQ
jgi:hypothetical protein